MSTQSETPAVKRPKVFISYKRNAVPDEELANQIFEILAENSDVFLDQRLTTIGEDWGQKIDRGLREADFVIVLLSADSIRSEMVRGEIETAFQSHKAIGRPAILPVRIAFRDGLPYPLGAYLNPFSFALWEQSKDTIRLIQQLLHAITVANALPKQSGDPFVNKAPLIERQDPLPSEGTQECDRSPAEDVEPFHISTASEIEADRAIRHSTGQTVVVSGPTQMGKSRLLGRLSKTARGMGKKVVSVDLQLADLEVLHQSKSFFQWFCARITEELNEEIRTDEYWKSVLGNLASAKRYFEGYLLRRVSGMLVVIIDELDTMFQTPFAQDFFAMMRSWHNSRAYGEPWNRVDLVLAARAEPYMWIQDPAKSPFNVGTIIKLRGFSRIETSALNERYGLPLSQGELNELQNLTGGQPFLTRRALYLVSSGSMSAIQVFRTADQDDGPFSEHLHYHYFQLHKKPNLLDALRTVIRTGACEDIQASFQLMGTGLVKRQDDDSIAVSNQLYKRYFPRRLGM